MTAFVQSLRQQPQVLLAYSDTASICDAKIADEFSANADALSAIISAELQPWKAGASHPSELDPSGSQDPSLQTLPPTAKSSSNAEPVQKVGDQSPAGAALVTSIVPQAPVQVPVHADGRHGGAVGRTPDSLGSSGQKQREAGLGSVSAGIWSSIGGALGNTARKTAELAQIKPTYLLWGKSGASTAQADSRAPGVATSSGSGTPTQSVNHAEAGSGSHRSRGTCGGVLGRAAGGNVAPATPEASSGREDAAVRVSVKVYLAPDPHRPVGLHIAPAEGAAAASGSLTQLADDRGRIAGSVSHQPPEVSVGYQTAEAIPFGNQVACIGLPCPQQPVHPHADAALVASTSNRGTACTVLQSEVGDPRRNAPATAGTAGALPSPIPTSHEQQPAAAASPLWRQDVDASASSLDRNPISGFQSVDARVSTATAKWPQLIHPRGGGSSGLMHRKGWLDSLRYAMGSRAQSRTEGSSTSRGPLLARPDSGLPARAHEDAVDDTFSPLSPEEMKSATPLNFT